MAATVGTAAARAAEVRRELVPSLVGMAAVVAVLAFVRWAFAPIVDPAVFAPWLGVMALAPAGLAVLVAVRFLRHPSDAETLRVWLPFGRIVRTILNLGTIASPWVLLPVAEPLLRALMLMLYIWFMATEVLSNNDPHGLTWVALAGLPMSLGAFLIVHDAAYAAPLTGFLTLTGASLYALERLRFRARAGAQVDALALPAPLEAAAVPPKAALARDGLTLRQIEVVRLLAEGQSNKDIARALGISPATVKTHVAQIIAITGSVNRTGASMRAQSLGLL